MSDDLKRVAERLRQWRDEAGLSLQGLASRSGVAASTIQKVERRQMVPTIAVLLKIAHGLGRRPSEFLDDEAPHVEVVHVRAADRRMYSDGGGGTVERLSYDVIDQRFEAFRVEHAPGGSMGQVPIHFDGEQLILGLSGELTVTIADTRYVVRAGDSLHWKARLPHSWVNEGAEPARFVIIGTLPQGMRGLLRAPTRVPVDTDATSSETEDAGRRA
jgi:transcriptional regulator with XRE-family HTH domain